MKKKNSSSSISNSVTTTISTTAASSNITVFLILISLIFLISTSLPYLIGLLFTPGDGKFMGFTRNIDDMAVYMSWIRQVMDGNLVIYNLFQESINAGMQVNIYFLLLGWIAKGVHISPGAVLHLFMVLQNAVLVYVFWLFSGLFFKEDKPRKIALLCFLFAGGFGGFMPSLNSIDLWQGEAITFMSAYLNPLFTISLIIMIGIFYNILRYFESFSLKNLGFASILFFILGNVHTYDCVIVACVWVFYVLFKVFFQKAGVKCLLLNAAALIFGAVTIGFNFLIYMKDDVYRSRVESLIPTPDIFVVLAGFGFLFILSFLGLFLYKSKKIHFEHVIFLAGWLILGLCVIYIPFSQQRKFIMGYAVPLSLISGAALFYFSSLLKKQAGNVLLIALIILMAFTNFYNLKSDINKLSELKTATHYSAYMSNDELEVMKFIRDNKESISDVWASPQLSLFVPAYTGVSVYYGHWSETPGYADKLREYFDFINGKTHKVFGKTFVIPIELAEGFEKNYPDKKNIFQNDSFAVFQ